MRRWLDLGIVAAAFIISALLLPFLPQEMASHWNAQGEADGFMPKEWGAFLVPLVMLGLVGLFWLLPRIDPLRRNVETFKREFHLFILLLLLFFLYVHALTLAWNLGFRFDMTVLFLPGLGVLFFFLGGLLRKAKRNWFIGIRTPWTLSSDWVWEKTHARGADLFRVLGIIMVLAAFSGEWAMWIALVPVLVVVIYLVIYSYLAYQAEKGA